MRSWKITEPKTLTKTEWSEPPYTENLVRVKITKAMITLSDVAIFSDEENTSNVIAGSYGIGIVTDIPENVLGIEKGDRVYLAPIKNCGECYNCLNGNDDKCANFLIAGDNANGFLRDFSVCTLNDIYKLPQGVTDESALYIEYVAKAISIIDKMGLQKGNHIAIIGAGNLGIILAQVMMYYQIVPIIIDNDDKNLETARSAGIYYNVNANDKPQDYINSVTGGRLCKGVVYITESYVNTKIAFNLASFGAPITITGTTYRSPKIDMTTACEKQLNIYCISNGYGNTSSAINLIKNKAVRLDKLQVVNSDFDAVKKVVENGAELFENKKTFTNHIINLL